MMLLKLKRLMVLIQTFLVNLLSGTASGERNLAGELNGGGFNIRIHSAEQKLFPPGEILLIDPKGRRSGHDPTANKTFKEIPGSSYEDESVNDDVSGIHGPKTKILDIRSLMSGEYILQVIGTEASRYDLEIRGYDFEISPSHKEFVSVQILKGAKHKYLIRYPDMKGGKMEVIPLH